MARPPGFRGPKSQGRFDGPASPVIELTEPAEPPTWGPPPTVAPKRAAVLGHPVAHSLSPVLHNAAYRALGLDGWSYDALDTTAEQLPDRLADLDETWSGLSLTMPLKHAVIGLVDGVAIPAALTRVANTVVRGDEGDLTAHNTDVGGIVAAIREVIRHGVIESAAVLGNGATATSALAALHDLGCQEVTVFARTKDDPHPLQLAADVIEIAVEPKPLEAAATELANFDVVISTLPAHAADSIAAELSEAGGLLLDVVYDPRPTDLLARWSALGGAISGGERLLLHQAAAQVELMTGRAAPLAAMDQALQEAL